ncbi:MAG: end-binding protein Ku [Gaiellales bacterium]|nr:end-binding protein Ku [Gaiellales bacterium]
MPRALWSGSISFGLVNAPVRMYTAISEHNVHFNLLHAKSGARIHYKKVTDSHPRDIPDDQIVKGYEVSDGEYVTLTDSEIAAAHLEGDKVIEIHDFVPLEEIDPIVFERTYYLGPADGAERVYALLARALESAGLVGIASFVFHDRDQLACLRVKDGAILLERMYFADEIRTPEAILPDRKATVDKGQLKLAVDLIERMQGSFDHSAYHDRYRERLMAIVDKKRKGQTITAPKVEERRAPDDLMAALEESLRAAVGKSRKAPKAPAKARTKARAKPAKARTRATSRSKA